MMKHDRVVKIVGEPWGVTFDATRGRILITDDYTDGIQVFSRDDLLSKDCFYYQGQGDLRFESPSGITIQPHTNRIILCDTCNNQVEIMTPEGEHVVTIGATNKESIRHGCFNYPIGICCKPGGDICVAEQRNDRVQMFDGAGRYLTKFGSKGSTDQQLSAPLSVATLDRHLAPSSAASSALLVSDYCNHRVSVWAADGSRFLDKFDVGTHSYAVCVDLRGYIYVSGHPRVVDMFDPRFNFKKVPLNASSRILGSFNGMCVDNENNLFATDQDISQIHVINL